MVTTEDKGSVQQLRQRKPIASTAATLGKSPASIILLPECTASCPRVEHGQKVTLAAVSEAGAEATTCSTSAEAMSESDTFSGFQEVDEEEAASEAPGLLCCPCAHTHRLAVCLEQDVPQCENFFRASAAEASEARWFRFRDAAV
eukprot:CAMPEP_0179101388 /NCGR_PEP_ID=MMETSP0796-20121207/46874_1 /TAXON_ID=73915 /ORGANISM="Pyrodinium bahamense, Strain pbaha01" /LENGTH=144 /DNA_ID=CAMNT_0020799237 /DNA_START=171 /DNA_END=602 /DNA_ORIENTATION=-